MAGYVQYGMRMRHMLHYFLLSLLLTAVLAGFACRTYMTAPISSDVQLSAEDVAVTEVWLKIHIAQNVLHDSIRLTRNDATVLTRPFRGMDTLLLDEQLLPRQIYSYKLYTISSNGAQYSSDLLTITTMDTTSHNFTWQIDTLGDGSSVLQDIALVSDSVFYGAGEFYLQDSTGQIRGRSLQFCTVGR